MAYAPHANEPELIAAQAAMLVDHAQRRLLYAGRILMAGGWLVLTYTTGGNHAANAEHALLGLVLLLIGVLLIMLALVASQFPEVAGPPAQPLPTPCSSTSSRRPISS